MVGVIMEVSITSTGHRKSPWIVPLDEPLAAARASPPHPCKPDLNPLNPTGSNASPYAGETVSGESFTSIDMPL